MQNNKLWYVIITEKIRSYHQKLEIFIYIKYVLIGY